MTEFAEGTLVVVGQHVLVLHVSGGSGKPVTMCMESPETQMTFPTHPGQS